MDPLDFINDVLEFENVMWVIFVYLSGVYLLPFFGRRTKETIKWIKGRWTGEYLGIGKVAQEFLKKLEVSSNWVRYHGEVCRRRMNGIRYARCRDIVFCQERYLELMVDSKLIHSSCGPALFNKYEEKLILKKVREVVLSLETQINNENTKDLISRLGK